MAVSSALLVGAIIVFLASKDIQGLSLASNNNLREVLSRRNAIMTQILSVGLVALGPVAAPSFAAEEVVGNLPVEVVASGDAKKMFNEARAREGQGNMEAAQRLYAKVTKYLLGLFTVGAILAIRNLRLNNNRVKDALSDLSRASALRGKPDGIIAQNLARAKELNGLYAPADRDYSLAISMTSNEVNPFWLRSALVKLQLGDVKGGFDLLKRVDNRFPEAPEVRAAYATFLAVTGDQIAAQRKYLEIPDIQRLKYINEDYLKNTIAWPPAAIEGLAMVTSVVEKRK
ncbi:hypothetical protein MHU86_25030 [Fragilaria crotonensis]|nr:hypothetical protein MHU86_25030 [Fragilaria crotonensis]